MRYFPVLFLTLCIVGCNLQDQPKEEERIYTADIQEWEIYKKPQDLILYLKYDGTEIINEEIILSFTFSVRNTTNDTIRLLANNCPSYDPFKIDGTFSLSFYQIEKDICYSNFLTYKYFNPGETTRYLLKMRLQEESRALKNQKIRIGFKGCFGAQGQTPENLIDLYTRINMVEDFPTYWSDYIELKDDYKQVQKSVQ